MMVYAFPCPHEVPSQVIMCRWKKACSVIRGSFVMGQPMHAIEMRIRYLANWVWSIAKQHWRAIVEILAVLGLILAFLQYRLAELEVDLARKQLLATETRLVYSYNV